MLDLSKIKCEALAFTLDFLSSPGFPRDNLQRFPEAILRINATSIFREIRQSFNMSSREFKPNQNGSGETSPNEAAQKKILVIDDDPVSLKALTMALTGKGYAVSSARDGAEAISAVREEVPDMLLVDVNLEPQDAFDGAAIWDGFQVTRWLRHLTAKKIPAIMISATDKEEYRTYSTKIGAETFMLKSLSNAALLQTIDARLTALC